MIFRRKLGEVDGHNLPQDSDMDNFNSQSVRNKQKREKKKSSKSTTDDDAPEGVLELAPPLISSSLKIDSKTELDDFNSQNVGEKKKRKKKKGSKSTTGADAPDGVLEQSPDDLIPSSLNLDSKSTKVGVPNSSQDSELDYYNSQSVSQKQKRKNKKGSRIMTEENALEGVLEQSPDDLIPSSLNLGHASNEVYGKQLAVMKKKLKFYLKEMLSQNNELDMCSSQDANKKKREKKADKSMADDQVHDEISELSQDGIPSSLNLESKSRYTGGHNLSQESELDDFNSQSVSQKQKRKKKKGSRSTTDDAAPNGVLELSPDDLILSSLNLDPTPDDVGGDTIHTPGKKKMKFSSVDDLSQDTELDIMDSQNASRKKKRKKKQRKKKQSDKSTPDEDTPDGVTGISEDDFKPSSPILDPTPDDVGGDTIHTPGKKKMKFSSVDDLSQDTELDIMDSQNASMKKKRKKKQSDKSTPDEDTPDGVTGISEDDFKPSSPILDSKCKNPQEYFGVIEKLLKKKTFSPAVYSKVLDEIHENVAPSMDLKMRLSELEIRVDWDVHCTHRVESKVVNLPTENELMEMRCLNSDLKTGIYLPSEDKIIMENWEKFSKEYGFENPEDFFTLRINNVYVLPHKECLNFVRYLGRGLPNRTLYSINWRFRRLFVKKKTGRLSGKNKEVFEKHVKHYGKKFCGLRNVLNKTSRELTSSARYLTGSLKGRSFKTCEEKTNLLKAILEVTNSKSYEDLQGKAIEWKKVGNILSTRSESCRKYWTRYLSGYLALKEPVPKKVVYAKIFKGLKEMNVGSSLEVNWQNLSPSVFGLPSAFLWNAFTEESHRLKIKYTGDNWRGAINELSAQQNEKNIKGIMDQKMFPCCKLKNSEIVMITN